jgi:predicted DNA-binding transcriptional regulator AlpA
MTSSTKPTTLLPRSEVRRRFGGISTSTLYKWMDEERIPRPVTLGPHRVGWIEDEIEAALQARIAARDARQAS